MYEHFIFSLGNYNEAKYLGIMFEINPSKMTDPEGIFVGFNIGFFNKALMIGVCHHDLNRCGECGVERGLHYTSCSKA